MIRSTFILMAFSISLLLASCTQGLGPAGFGGSSQNQSDGGSRRPTEEGEGVPGYLVDPESIAINSSSDVVVVKGKPGSVKADQGEAKDVLICLQLAKSQEVRNGLTQGTAISATTIAKKYADPDGSFRIEANTALTADRGILLNLRGNCKDPIGREDLQVGSKAKIAISFPTLDDGFLSDPDVLLDYLPEKMPDVPGEEFEAEGSRGSSRGFALSLFETDTLKDLPLLSAHVMVFNYHPDCWQSAEFLKDECKNQKPTYEADVSDLDYFEEFGFEPATYWMIIDTLYFDKGDPRYTGEWQRDVLGTAKFDIPDEGIEFVTVEWEKM